MCDEWMQGLQLQLTPEEFQQLPRNGAFRYDLIGGQVYIIPRPKHYHALFDLRPFFVEEVAGIQVRALAADDWTALVPVFGRAFVRVPPSLDSMRPGVRKRPCSVWNGRGPEAMDPGSRRQLRGLPGRRNRRGDSGHSAAGRRSLRLGQLRLADSATAELH